MPRRKVTPTTTTTPTKVTPAAIRAGDPDALLEAYKDYPTIDLIARGFSNPTDPGSAAILLHDEDTHACTNSEHMNRVTSPEMTTCPARLPNGKVCGKPVRRWFVYWFNVGKEGRASQMRSRGYLPVEVKELLHHDDVADMFRTEDLFVRRGDRGQEMLGKMPLVLYNHRKQVQRDAWNSGITSPKKLREGLAESAGTELGDEAGQSIHDGAIKIESVRSSRTTLGDEAHLSERD